MIPEFLQKWKNRNVTVGLSGGVDSAVAAYLLREAGARVFAVFMKNWDDEDERAGCHDKEDLITAAAVAEQLGLPFETVNFVREYKENIFADFVAELEAGRTPNPDVLCNERIKFSLFHQHAIAQGAEAIATGHYAGAEQMPGGDEWRLCKGEDSNKDQSYFLHRLTQAQLARSVFPLARWHKTAVRDCAKRVELANWARKDSTGLCFVGERDFPEFIRPYVRATAGEMTDAVSGKVLGEHRGLPFYTIGQRKGLNIGGGDGPWFVSGKDAKLNRLIVARQADAHLLTQNTVTIAGTHWISRRPPKCHWVYTARLRHRQPPATCTLTQVDTDSAQIFFPQPQRAPTPGQYAVLYDGNTCLGGGTIA